MKPLGPLSFRAFFGVFMLPVGVAYPANLLPLASLRVTAVDNISCSVSSSM